LAWALNQHSELWTSDESQVLWDLFGDAHWEKNFQREGKPGGSWLLKQGIDRQEFLSLLGISFNAMFTKCSQGKRWVDQTPSYTLMSEMLADMFPGAYFLHILRDGRRVTHSMINYQKQFPAAARPTTPWASNFRESCRTWRRFVETSMSFAAGHP